MYLTGSRKNVNFSFLIITLALFIGAPVFAAPGDIDSSFNAADGRVLTRIGAMVMLERYCFNLMGKLSSLEKGLP